jgi:hypothetical protein
MGNFRVTCSFVAIVTKPVLVSGKEISGKSWLSGALYLSGEGENSLTRALHGIISQQLRFKATVTAKPACTLLLHFTVL